MKEGVAFAIAYTGFIGILVGASISLASPSFHADIQKSGDCATIMPCYRDYPIIQRTTYYNTECLEAKGYKIRIGATAFGERLPKTIFISKSDLNIDQLLADCKECNTHMDIDYEYSGFYTQKMHDATTRLNWSSCRVRRELK